MVSAAAPNNGVGLPNVEAERARLGMEPDTKTPVKTQYLLPAFFFFVLFRFIGH